jgi:hypothetical protein
MSKLGETTLRKGQKYPDAYYPGSEELEPDEMRVTALGTGMPNLWLMKTASFGSSPEQIPVSKG